MPKLSGVRATMGDMNKYPSMDKQNDRGPQKNEDVGQTDSGANKSTIGKGENMPKGEGGKTSVTNTR